MGSGAASACSCCSPFSQLCTDSLSLQLDSFSGDRSPACPCAVCGPRGALQPSARSAVECLVRSLPRYRGPRGRLAGRARRLAGGRRRARLIPPLAGRRNRHRNPDRFTGAVARGDGGPAGRDAVPVARDRRRSAAQGLPAQVGAISLRRGRLQGRLRPRRPDSMAGGRVPRRRDGARRRNTPRDRSRRAGRCSWRTPGAAVRAGGATEPLRPRARPGVEAHGVGLLSRAEQLGR
jgi:hypothetical protein